MRKPRFDLDYEKYCLNQSAIARMLFTSKSNIRNGLTEEDLLTIRTRVAECLHEIDGTLLMNKGGKNYV